jgi:hypothetical protein
MPNNYAEFQSIPIDFDVFKALTARLESPADSYNGVLRRLLQLPTAGAEPTPMPTGDQSWHVGGVTFPSGTEFRAKYKGRTYLARVEDGALVYEGTRYDSPSPAAIAVTGNSVNGWNFWQCKLPGRTNWVTIASLRS